MSAASAELPAATKLALDRTLRAQFGTLPSSLAAVVAGLIAALGVFAMLSILIRA